MQPTKIESGRNRNPKRPIFRNEIESIIKNKTNKKTRKNPKPSNKQKSGPDSFIGEFCQTFKEELIPILLKIFQKLEEEGKLPNFCEASITLIPKINRDTTRKEITGQYP